MDVKWLGVKWLLWLFLFGQEGILGPLGSATVYNLINHDKKRREKSLLKESTLFTNIFNNNWNRNFQIIQNNNKISK